MCAKEGQGPGPQRQLFPREHAGSSQEWRQCLRQTLPAGTLLLDAQRITERRGRPGTSRPSQQPSELKLALGREGGPGPPLCSCVLRVLDLAWHMCSEPSRKGRRLGIGGELQARAGVRPHPQPTLTHFCPLDNLEATKKVHGGEGVQKGIREV